MNKRLILCGLPKTYVHNIVNKLAVNERVQAAVVALRWRIVE